MDESAIPACSSIESEPLGLLSYQVAFNRLDIMSIHGLQGVVDEESDHGRQAHH